MSSPCLSGGGRAYGLEFEKLKSAASVTSSSRTSHTSSPSSTISEASNSPLAISTRKPRTPRKRPNQTYNEAAALLSTAYPTIFSNNSIHRKFTKPQDIILEPSELLLPFRVFDNSGFLIHQPKTIEPKVTTPTSCDKSWLSNGSLELCDNDLDAESILDGEIEEGIDSIMGNASDAVVVGNSDGYGSYATQMNHSSWYGYPMGMGYNFTKGITAFRHVDQPNFWDFPIVDMLQISPRLTSSTSRNNTDRKNNAAKKNPNPNSTLKSKLKQKLNSADKKKKKKVEKSLAELEIAKDGISSVIEEEEEDLLNLKSNETASLQLKLNYDAVLSAWCDRGSPFSEEFEGNDVSVGDGREASVLRYKEKRRTRLFSKKIRYQVRKVNADRRPRMKGRFVRRPNLSANSES